MKTIASMQTVYGLATITKDESLYYVTLNKISKSFKTSKEVSEYVATLMYKGAA